MRKIYCTNHVDQCSQPFFFEGTLKIIFHILRNPLLIKTFIGQRKKIAGSDIQVLLNCSQGNLFVKFCSLCVSLSFS